MTNALTFSLDGLLKLSQLTFIIIIVYTLYKAGYLELFLNYITNLRNRKIEVKNIDFEIPFNNKYTKYTDTNVELPFDIYYKTPKKKKIFLPKWFTLIVTHKDFVIELLTRNINNNIDDPIRDDKLIKSILKDLKNINKLKK